MKKPSIIIPAERIQRTIYLIRGERIMIDADLAALYGVTTAHLNRAVKRNLSRFPQDFMFQLSSEESENLILQIGRSNVGRGGRRKPISAFTEQGVAMLSSVLRSEQAIQVNVAVMRAFVQLRRVLASHSELAQKLNELEQRIESHDEAIRSLFEAIRQLMDPGPPTPDEGRKEIGFHVREEHAPYRIRRGRTQR